MLLLLGCHVGFFLGSSSGVVLVLFFVLNWSWARSGWRLSVLCGSPWYKALLGSWTPPYPRSPTHVHGAGAVQLQRGRAIA